MERALARQRQVQKPARHPRRKFPEAGIHTGHKYRAKYKYLKALSIPRTYQYRTLRKPPRVPVNTAAAVSGVCSMALWLPNSPVGMSQQVAIAADNGEIVGTRPNIPM